ncbi:tRNA lysidine(34) synthetase TilS [Croceimicrobium sp.]|uniref:tRNA lysidine(34) synthetase TilS n=1 Tax=Croceimicrobium sp. TaxID=2828340 RepID=UPI003BAC0AF5
MLDTLQAALAKYDIDSRDKLLLAISGGLDSVVLLHALLELGFQAELAHCNFGLRGEASEEDAQFCQRLAQQHDLPIHIKKCETETYAQEKGLSIQMAARDLRYAFFEELDLLGNYRAILTAHHGDDQLETMIFKLARGSALEAVAGIREKRQKYLRPMLGILRNEIEAFAKERKLTWREDASNAETKYLRNAYRHRLIPLWEEIQPDLKGKMLLSSRLLREQSEALDELLEEKLSQALVREEDWERLNYDSMVDKAWFGQLLYKWLSPKGRWDWPAVHHLWQSRKGRYTENEAYRLYQGEACYELRKQSSSQSVNLKIATDDSQIDNPIQLDFEVLPREKVKLDGLREHHFLDYEALEFPLILRNWRDGDRFQPLGMSGTKKLSDYWIDQKMPMAEKDSQLVLESAGEIVALIGHRIDHRFRVRNSTKTIYFVRLK